MDQMDPYRLKLSKNLEPEQVAEQFLLCQIPPIFADHKVVAEPAHWALLNSIEVHALPLHDDVVECAESAVDNGRWHLIFGVEFPSDDALDFFNFDRHQFRFAFLFRVELVETQCTERKFAFLYMSERNMLRVLKGN